MSKKNEKKRSRGHDFDMLLVRFTQYKMPLYAIQKNLWSCNHHEALLNIAPSVKLRQQHLVHIYTDKSHHISISGSQRSLAQTVNYNQYLSLMEHFQMRNFKINTFSTTAAQSENPMFHTLNVHRPLDELCPSWITR